MILISALLDCLKKRTFWHLHSLSKVLKHIINFAFLTNSVLPGNGKVLAAVEGAPGAKDEEI